MKNNSYIGISFIILIFGIWAVPKIVEKFKGSTADLVVIGKAPAFSFTNQDHKTITQENFKNKVYVVEFFFTSCPTICPIMNKKMVELQNEFYGNPSFGVASFTIDPERDSPEVLKNYAKSYGITHINWHLLTGDKDKIHTLANKGFNIYAGQGAIEDGGFEHSGLFALIDKNGNIRSRKDANGNPIIYYRAVAEDDGFADDISALKKDIAILLKE